MWGCKQSVKQDIQGLHQGEAAIPLSYMAENVHTINILIFLFQRHLKTNSHNTLEVVSLLN